MRGKIYQSPLILWFVLALVLTCCGGSLFSQDPAPKPPFFAEKAPPASSWTIDFTYSQSPAGNPWPTSPRLQQKKIVRSEISKSGDVKLAKSSYDGGVVQDVWTTGGLMVLKDPEYAHKIVRRPASGGDFPELLWINDAQFKGRERVGEKDCLIFQKELYPLQFSDPGLFAAEMDQEVKTLDLGSPVPVTAWIDAVSKLPVKMTIGGDTRNYVFSPTLNAPLNMPSEYRLAIAGVEEKFRSLVKPLAKP